MKLDADRSEISSDVMYKRLEEKSARQLPIFWSVCIFILVIEFAERICYYTFAGSQEFFLEELGYGVTQSAGINAAFTTLSYLWPLVGGYVADTYLGRYTTIMWFAVFYFVGALVSALAARPGPARNGPLYLIGSMGFVALGAGGIKPNISNFGADQYDASTAQGKKAQATFFTQYYVAINCGSLIAYGGLTTLCSTGLPGVIPRDYGYFAGYSLGTMAMALALVAFASRRSAYVRKPPKGDALRGVLLHLASAVAMRSPRGIATAIGFPCIVMGPLFSVVLSFQDSQALRLVAGVLVLTGFFGVWWGCGGDRRWVYRAKKNRYVTRQHTADFLRVMPIMLSVSIAFQVPYCAMNFWFQQEACQMDLRVSGSLQINGSFFTVMDCVAIIICTPLILKVLNPLCEGLFGSFDREGKLLLGIGFSVMSVLWAAALEVIRRSVPLTGVQSLCAPAGVPMSGMGAWWIAGPYAFMGIAEVYVNPTIYHMTYTQTPLRLRSLAQAVCLLTSSVSTGIFTVITKFFGSCSNLNETHLEYGYLTCVVLALPFLGCYFVARRHFEEKDLEGRGLDFEGEDEAFKEVAYQHIGFFKDYASPTSMAGSPWSSPGSSPVTSPNLRVSTPPPADCMATCDLEPPAKEEGVPLWELVEDGAPIGLGAGPEVPGAPAT